MVTNSFPETSTTCPAFDALVVGLGERAKVVVARTEVVAGAVMAV